MNIHELASRHQVSADWTFNISGKQCKISRFAERFGSATGAGLKPRQHSMKNPTENDRKPDERAGCAVAVGSATARPEAEKRDEWARGYFCAVALYLRENYQEGTSGTEADSLFRMGGDWRKADPEDIETFRAHGLLPNATMSNAGETTTSQLTPAGQSPALALSHGSAPSLCDILPPAHIQDEPRGGLQ